MASYILERSHEAVAGVARSGDSVVDATVGNGWDAAFLARLVGSAGRVIGLDVQPAAIEATRRRLDKEGLLDRCTLIQGSHADPAEIARLADAAPTAIMFNLGYLPGGDKSITTEVGTTVASLEGMLDVLSPGGILTIVCYRGHHGAEEEYRAVQAWTAGLERPAFYAERITDPGGPEHAPVLFVVRKG